MRVYGNIRESMRRNGCLRVYHPVGRADDARHTLKDWLPEKQRGVRLPRIASPRLFLALPAVPTSGMGRFRVSSIRGGEAYRDAGVH